MGTRLPTVHGLMRRRILANYRADPAVIQRLIPSLFRPKLHNGFAVVGICLIRLEQIRPKLVPEVVGLASENAAHRVAVQWNEGNVAREGVYISRRDTDSHVSHLLGGRLFPGEHNLAVFTVEESESEIKLAMRSTDGSVAVQIEGSAAKELPAASIFHSLTEASSFFEGGALGYSVTSQPQRLDGLRLETKEWRVEPLQVSRVYSSYFADEDRFPKGSLVFDHALIMRDVVHEWHRADDIFI